ncbi:hypothetical protein V3C33_14250 [Micrococcaceae bacterium Sec5.7]
MGITHSAPTIARIMSWFASRQALCAYCREALKSSGDESCSDYCAEADAEDQAHG